MADKSFTPDFCPDYKPVQDPCIKDPCDGIISKAPKPVQDPCIRDPCDGIISKAPKPVQDPCIRDPCDGIISKAPKPVQDPCAGTKDACTKDACIRDPCPKDACIRDPCPGTISKALDQRGCEEKPHGSNDSYCKGNLDEVTKHLQQVQEEVRHKTGQISLLEGEKCKLSSDLTASGEKYQALNRRFEDNACRLEKAMKEICELQMKVKTLETESCMQTSKNKEQDCLREEICHLKAQLLEKTRLISECNLENQRKDCRINELLAECANLRESFCTFQGTVSQKDNTICQLQKQNNRCSDQCEENKRMLSRCQGEVAGLNCQLEEIPRLKEQLACMQQQLRDKEYHACDLNVALNDLKSQLKCKDDEICDHKQAMTSLRYEIADLKNKIDDQKCHLSQLKDVERTNKELEGKLACKDQQICEYKVQLSTCDDAGRDKKKQINQLSSQLGDVTCQVEAEKHKFKSIENTNQDLNCTIKCLEDKVEDQKQNMTKLKWHIQQQAQEIDSWKKQVSDLNRCVEAKMELITEKDMQLCLAKRESKTLEDTIDEHKKQICYLNECIKKQSREMENLSRRMAELNGIIEEKVALIKEKEGQICQLQIDLRNEKCKMEGCCDQLQMKKKELSEAQNHLEQACCEIKKQSNELQQVNCALRKMHQHTENLCAEIRNAKEELEKRERKIREQEVDLRESYNESERMAREIDIHLHAVQKQKDEACRLQHNYECLQRDHDTLKQKLCEAECRADNANCDLMKCQAELQSRSMCMERQEKTLQSLQQTLACKDDEISFKSQKIGELENRLMETKQQLEEACSMYRAKESAACDYLKQVQLLERETSDQKRDLRHQKDKLDELEDTVKTMKCNMDSYKAQIQSMRDPQNIKSSLALIERMLSDNESVTESKKTTIACTQQELTTIFQSCCQSQEEGMLKVAKLLISKVCLSKEVCEAKSILEQKEKQIRSCKQDFHRMNQESNRITQDLRDTIVKLEADYQNKAASHKQLQQAYDRQEYKVYELQKQLEEECKRYQNTMAELKRNEAQWKTEREEAACQRRALEDEMRNVSCTSKKLQAALEKADQTCTELTRNLCEERLAKEDAMRKIEDLKTQLCSKCAQLSDMERKLEETTQRCRCMQQKIDSFSRMELQIQRIIKSFLDKTNMFNIQEPGFARSRGNNPGFSDCNRFDDFERRLDNVICIASDAPEARRTAECYKEELLHKERELQEFRVHLQREKATVEDNNRAIAKLKNLVEHACDQARKSDHELDLSKQHVARLESELCELSQFKSLFEQGQVNEKCLQENLCQKEMMLCEEMQAATKCKEAFKDVQSNCRQMMEELRSKDDYINMMGIQVKRLECEIRALNEQIRALQNCSPAKPNYSSC